MKDLLEKYWTLRSKFHNYGEEMKDENNDPGFFGMCFNYITLTCELLDHYEKLWSQSYSLPPKKIEKSKAENGERVITIAKWAFIAIVSAMEFDAKIKIQKSNRKEFSKLVNDLKNDKIVYFEDIIKISRDNQFLPHDRFNKLEAILYIRHCLIHNNGVSGKDRLYAPIKNQLKQFKKDKMIQGDLHTFYNFSNLLADYYKDWLKKIQ